MTCWQCIHWKTLPQGTLSVCDCFQGGFPIIGDECTEFTREPAVDPEDYDVGYDLGQEVPHHQSWE